MRELDYTLKYALKNNGIKAKIDGAETTIIRKGQDTIITTTPFKVGSLVVINGVNYIIVSNTTPYSQSTYYKGSIRKTDDIKVNNFTTYSYVSFMSVSETNLDQLAIVNNKYKFIVPTMNVAINDVITFKGGKYEVTTVDNTNENILVLFMPLIPSKSTEYTISFSENSTSIQQNKTYQIDYTCKNNTTVVSNPTVTFTSSASAIATVDENGLITGVSEGVAVITGNYNGATATINVTVTAIPDTPDKPDVELTPIKIVPMGDNFDFDTGCLDVGKTETFQVYVDDGNDDSRILPEGRTFTFTLTLLADNGDEIDRTSTSEVTKITDTSITITGKYTSKGTLRGITAVDNADNDIYDDFYLTLYDKLKINIK